MKGQRLLILFIALLFCSGQTVSGKRAKTAPLSVMDAHARYYREQFMVNLRLIKYRVSLPDTIKYFKSTL